MRTSTGVTPTFRSSDRARVTSVLPLLPITLALPLALPGLLPIARLTIG